MTYIHVLDEPTINQIAAGEVVERPSAVVKELIENAVDAGATAITAEIKEGGISFIRITDNGAGISMEDIPLAFMRHSTSKIRVADDLLTITSLGFRGEALSSIAAVSQVELITKTPSALNGCRYIIEGGIEKSIEEIGSPSGTTIIIRNLFFNTPARKKFLKSTVTETGYINDLMERLIVSHPGISFKYIVNNQVKLQSSGNNNIKDLLYSIYGRDITRELIPVTCITDEVKITGLIGKPVINRGNRNFENYYVNGRYVRNNTITRAIEEAYKSFLMQHKFPFTALFFEINPTLIDVNVHPQKTEIRLKDSETIYQLTYNVIRDSLLGKELIPKVTLTKETEAINTAIKPQLPEPFEINRRKLDSQTYHLNSQINTNTENNLNIQANNLSTNSRTDTPDNIIAEENPIVVNESNNYNIQSHQYDQISSTSQQLNMFNNSDTKFLSEKAFEEHKIIGQVFQTYWLVEYNKNLFIIDQHAAHEKVLYERIMAVSASNTYSSQQLLPPIVLTLTLREQEVIKLHEESLNRLGYEFEHFGGNEYSVRAVPADLFGLSEKELILEFLDEMADDLSGISLNPTTVLEKIASLSCKAAVKANHSFSTLEAKELIRELLTLNNPYNCPHGRPVIISMSQYELERKFKRIV